MIQSNWRRFRDRRAYLAYKKRKWAAGIIALIWFSNVKIAKTRAALKLTRLKQLENFRRRQKVSCYCYYLKKALLSLNNIALFEGVYRKMAKNKELQASHNSHSVVRLSREG